MASLPSVASVMAVPWLAANNISAIMLLPLIVLLPQETSTEQANRLAVLANFAAARACRPSLLIMQVSWLGMGVN